MICEAEKLSGLAPVQAVPDKGIAVSIRASWDAVSKIVDVAVPLRRPKRRQPSREAEQEYIDLDLARQALADNAGIMPYSEFRKELGLGE